MGLLLGLAGGLPQAVAGEATIKEPSVSTSAVGNKAAPLLVAPPHSAASAVQATDTAEKATSRRTPEEPDTGVTRRLDELLTAGQKERQKRLQLLREQIRRLEKLLHQQPAAKDAQASRPPLASSFQGPHPRGPYSLASSAPRPHDGHRDPTEKIPARTTTASSRGAVIDSLSLADSLFGADEIAQALQVYQTLSPEKLPAADRTWVRYQIASCHRRLGNVGASEQGYRELAGSSDERIAAQARWWLDALDKRKRLENSLKGVNEALGPATETAGKGKP
jgi:hypothetical protein